MAGDDQYIIDTLLSLPNDLLRYSIDVTDALERRVDQLALHIRETLSSASWLPPSARPAPPPQYIPASARLPPLAPKGFFLWTKDWISEHRAITAAVVAFAGTGAFIYWKQKKDYLKKRRAKRTANGQRSEVVLVAGAVNASFPRSLVQDLERRGFIVYVVVNDPSEEELIKAESKADILPLHIDVTKPHEIQSVIANFAQLLSSPPNRSSPLHLSGLVLVPFHPASYPPTPIETTDPSTLSDALNTRVLHPIATLQAFLRPLIEHHSRILVITPSVPSSLRLPFHGVESTISSAIEGFVATLAAEMRPLHVPVAHFRLGNFEYGHAGADRRQIALQRPAAAEMLAWPPEARASYGEAYRAWVAEPAGAPGARWSDYAAVRPKGSPLRELNNAVFDALTQTRDPSGVWRVGKGSWIYEVVGRFAPWGSVGWAVGLRTSRAF